MNLTERANVVRAMDTIARCINDENVFYGWLMNGVPDGAIQDNTKNEELEFLCDDKSLSELMATFLRLMKRAAKSGGLYCDRVVSQEGRIGDG